MSRTSQKILVGTNFDRSRKRAMAVIGDIIKAGESGSLCKKIRNTSAKAGKQLSPTMMKNLEGF